MIVTRTHRKPAPIEKIEITDTINRKTLVVMPSTVKRHTVTMYLSGFNNSKLQFTPDEARAVAKEINNLAQQVEGDFMYE